MSKTICVWNANHDQPHAYVIDGGDIVGPCGNQRETRSPVVGANPLDHVRTLWPTWTVGLAKRDAGEYYPRIFRGVINLDKSPPVDDTPHFSEFVSSLEQENLLAEQLAAICRVVHPALATQGAFGSEIRNLLILACTEVEAQWKGILLANGYAAGGRLTTNDYIKLPGPLSLADYRIQLLRYHDYPAMKPFDGWSVANPTTSLPWYDAYNKVKHDRAANFAQATLAHAIQAVAALNILLVAQHGLTNLREYFYSSGFFGLDEFPKWTADERTYPPLAAGAWTAVNYPL